MQVITAKLCCSDVFSLRFVRSPTINSCFNRTARRLLERSQLTVKFLQRTVLNFIEPSVWPLAIQQPRLKSGRLCCLGALQQSVYRIPFPVSNLDDLEDRVRTCWESLDQQTINKSIDQWRDRLNAVVRVNGGHIEQCCFEYLVYLMSCSVV